MKKNVHTRLNPGCLFVLFSFLMLYGMHGHAQIRYVKPVASGSGNGSSWANASSDLQAMINASTAGEDIWVAAGTYVPNRRADATGVITINDRDNAFVLKSGVRIFGGFNGTETATSQRNFAANSTILSGDMGTAGSYTDNCYHVVVAAGPVSGTALNGFHIRYGNANGSGTITVNTISIGRGSGAGMRINSSSPTISNCIFSANITSNNGGGMVCDNASPAITNCLFSGNTANDGAAILNTNASATDITNCTFSGNNATATGGAIRNGSSSSPLVSNCIIWGNLAAGITSAIYNADAGSVPVVNYTLVQGGYTGTNNIDANPLFVSPVAATLAPTLSGDYRLQLCSPGINGGLNSYVPGSINNDLDYNPRIHYGKVDCGVYEKPLTLAVPNGSGVVFVDSSRNGNGSSWGNAVKELADALIAAKYNSSITQIWVAKGTYYPKYNAADIGSLDCNNSNRRNSFVLVDGLKMYGGFAGGETDTSEMNPTVNITTLSGNIGSQVLRDDNTFHVLIAANLSSAHLAGFHITEGQAIPFQGYTVNGIPVDPAAGAGLYSSGSNLYLRNCHFFQHKAEFAGGGLFYDAEAATVLTVIDCNWYDNEISSDYLAASTGLSAAVHIVSYTQALYANFSGCLFTNNTALHISRNLFGGALHIGGYYNFNMTNCDFIANKAAKLGGAIDAIASDASSSLNFTNVNFEADSAYAGGAIRIAAAGGVFKNCNFNSNNAIDGAAIYSSSADVKVYNCTFSGNTAFREGAAVYANTDMSEFVNCLFNGNKITTGSGTLRLINSTAKITNCSLVGNKKAAGNDGSAIYATSGNPEIHNCIAWGNEGQSGIGNPIVTPGPVTYSVVQGGFIGTGNINADPLFINPQPASSAPTLSGDYHLQKCSPAINAGNNAAVPMGITTDLDSSLRIAMVTVDMGAYEKLLAKPSPSGIVYVDHTKNGNGSNWANAVPELSDALKAAYYDNTIQQIWTATGTYMPAYFPLTLSCDGANQRDKTFLIVNNVKLVGGFAGGETDTAARDFIANETILSGDIGIAANHTDNSYHVLLASGAAGNGGIDGFTITHGQADVSTNFTLNGNIVYNNYGAGMYVHSASPFLSHCRFMNNYASGNGGAFAAINSNSSFSKNHFSSNSAGNKGGAVSLQQCSSTINNTVFSANSVNGPGPNNLAGGLYAENASLHVFGSSFLSNSVLNGDGGAAVIDLSTGSVFNSCIISGNTASNRAGGYYNLSSVSSLHNSLFSGNRAGAGGGAGIYNALAASLSITNCTISGNKTTGNGGGILTASPCIVGNTIIHNNIASLSTNTIYSVFVTPTVNNCIIQGGYAGIANYDINPLFVLPQSTSAAPTTLGDYRLQACSPALNLGDNSLILPGISKDLDSLDRIKFTTVDIGAYEKQDIDLANTTWKGINTNWNDKINWCGGYIPSDTTNVTVPLTLNNPVIQAGYDNEAKNLTLASNTALDIANTGKFTINGTYTNNGCTITNHGKWVMAGSSPAQLFPGTFGNINAMNHLEINNPSGIVLNKTFYITGSLIPTAGIINVNARIILSSSDTATASVDVIQPGASIVYSGPGNFVVERFINTGTSPGQHTKTWQFLSTPTTGQSIYQAWQEGGAVPAGFGTWITGTGTGFDAATALPSLKFFNEAAVNWTAVTNTGNSLVNKLGYMLFVRGDRTVNTFNGTPNNTILRSTGQIFTPTNPPPSVAVSANKFQTFGNPYASRIEFNSVYNNSTGINDVFYVWDPKLAGSYNVGGYQTISGITGYIPTVGIPPAGNAATDYYPAGIPSPYIESGQAVFVKGNATGGNINFNEQVKVSGSRLVNRPVNPNNPVTRRQFLFTSLFTNTGVIADGNIIAFEKGFGNDVNGLDAEKIMNGGENFGLIREGKFLAVEAHEPVKPMDTIFYNMSNLRKQPYQLRFAPVNMGAVNYQPYLADRFSNTETPLSVTDSSFVDFEVTGNMNSAASNRFYIVFKKKGKQQLIITDTKSIRQNGFEPLYHKQVTEINKAGITVYPNPVIDRNIQLWFKAMPDGVYALKLYSASGQLVHEDKVFHQGGDAAWKVTLSPSLPSGIYRLEVITGSGEKSCLPLQL